MSDGFRADLEPAIAAARCVCALLEGVAQMDRWDFLDELEGALITALYEVRRLPSVEPATEDLIPDLPQEVAQRYTGIGLSEWFPWWDSDPGPWNSDRHLVLVEDDLASVWNDLMEVLVAFDDPAVPVADVAWELRFGYDTHWGPHAVAALPVIHRMCR